MPSLTAAVTAPLQAAIAAALGPEFAGSDPVLRPSRFADLQVNAPLALAKRAGRPPRDVAAAIVEDLDLTGICSTVEVSGPGFVNLVADPAWVSAQADALILDPADGLVTQPRQTVVIDYSAPNVAKEMHVGHLRTTVVGDALARTLEALGHRVIRQNHIGDWGTPFGMLIEHLLDVGVDSAEAADLREDPNTFYQRARAAFDADPGFAARARARVVALQGGDPATLELWHQLVAASKVYFNRIYHLLDVTLTDEDLAGESMYNDDLPAVCTELAQAGLARISDGALCAFPAGFTGRDDEPMAMIVRKSDGGYGYATTDLAAIRHRVRDLHANRIVYVIGAPQALHLQMVYAQARQAGWLPEDVETVHVQIGSVLGSDGKMLKTRSGQSVKLMELLEEAVARATDVLADLRPDLPAEQAATIARQIGIGAVKYADLSVAHDTEYTFDFDRMLALSGNTGPYLQYAVARIRSIFRRAGLDPADPRPIVVTEPAERDLGLLLASFGDVVAGVGDDLAPHKLCAYLFDVAQQFSTFYEQCPILKAPDDATRTSRLGLAAVTERVLVRGLSLLGLEAPEQM